MNPTAGMDRFTTRQHTAMFLAGYLLISGVALRRLTMLTDTFSIASALGLLVTFSVLYTASHLRISRRLFRYPRLYFTIQVVIVQILGLYLDYLDVWTLLYVVLGIQVVALFPKKEALVWGGLFITSTLVTLSLEFGLLSGLGRAMAYTAIGIFFITYDIQVARREDAQDESQVLLEELRTAHQRLQEQAAQAEQLAAAEERNRIAQEIHDSVGQKVFAIQLMTESTCMLLATDPQRAAAQLVLLQEQTQAALGQMRELIGRWRTPPKVREPAPPIPLPADA